jgi:hypothetical protein
MLHILLLSFISLCVVDATRPEAEVYYPALPESTFENLRSNLLDISGRFRKEVSEGTFWLDYSSFDAPKNIIEEAIVCLYHTVFKDKEVLKGAGNYSLL